MIILAQIVQPYNLQVHHIGQGWATMTPLHPMDFNSWLSQEFWELESMGCKRPMVAHP